MSVCKCFQPLSDVSHLFFFLSKLSNKNTCLPSRLLQRLYILAWAKTVALAGLHTGMGKNSRPGGLKNMVSSSRDDRSKDGMITVRSWFLSKAMFLPSF